MERKVFDYLQSNNMLSKGDGVVVGVSGGADSMCLLRILLSMRERLELKLLVLHVNHGIRGASADGDEQFVKEFCEANNTDFKAVHINVPEIASREGLTEEEAGRKYRYRSFFEACGENGFGKIAVAHNKDDNAETVLFNIARGSGISGLRGIRPTRVEKDVTIIRPLLNCTRKEIEDYLAEHGQSYRTDETNFENDYSRNRIRNEIMPLLGRSVNSAVSSHLAELAGQAGELEELLEELTLKAMDGLGYIETDSSIKVGVKALGALYGPVRKNVLRKLYMKLSGSLKDIESTHIRLLDELLGKSVGKRIDLPYGVCARRDYDELILELADPAGISKAEIRGGYSAERAVLGTGPDVPVRRNTDEIRIDRLPVRISLGNEKYIELSCIPCEKTLNIPKNDYTKFFDYDKIRNDMVLRTRRTGDYLSIRSHGDCKFHKKSLKTWMVDNKIARNERDEIVLLAEDNHIMWIIGYRGDDAYPVTEETRTVLKAELTGCNRDGKKDE